MHKTITYLSASSSAVAVSETGLAEDLAEVDRLCLALGCNSA